jgi:hypothetical protein
MGQNLCYRQRDQVEINNYNLALLTIFIQRSIIHKYIYRERDTHTQTLTVC